MGLSYRDEQSQRPLAFRRRGKQCEAGTEISQRRIDAGCRTSDGRDRAGTKTSGRDRKAPRSAAAGIDVALLQQPQVRRNRRPARMSPEHGAGKNAQGGIEVEAVDGAVIRSWRLEV